MRRLGAHIFVRHVGAEGVPRGAGRHVLRQYRTVNLGVLLTNAPDDTPVVTGGSGVTVFAAEKEAAAPIWADLPRERANTR